VKTEFGETDTKFSGMLFILCVILKEREALGSEWPRIVQCFLSMVGAAKFDAKVFSVNPQARYLFSQCAILEKFIPSDSFAHKP